jgi:uncharacterized membrane protein
MRDAWGDDYDDDFGRGRADGPFLRAIFERLETTPGQEREIRSALEELKGMRRTMKDEMRDTREDLGKAMRSDDFDVDVLGGLFARQNDAMDEMRKAVVGALGRVHATLDEGQRERLARFIERAGGLRPRFA